MAAQLRQLRQKIKTVKSTAKITRAQEMIATSRIVKAQQAVAASKPYADQITQALTALVSHNVGIDHPLLEEQPADNRSAVLIITSDRGFCGAYNANVIREAESLIQALRDDDAGEDAEADRHVRHQRNGAAAGTAGCTSCRGAPLHDPDRVHGAAHGRRRA